MRCARSTFFTLLLALACTLLLAACDLGNAPRPRPSVDPSASPIIETDREFCAALDVLESEHQILREIRLRPGNRRALDDQFDQLDIAWDELRVVAPRGMSDQIEAMDWAVIDLGLAVEDYTTTARLSEAADHLLRRDIAFDKAIGRLRARTTCAPWAPTPKPLHTPSPAPSPSASANASASPSAAQGSTTA